jgi:N-acetylneuraminic acid mutarotase
MPTPRADLSACVVNDQIYLIGGKKYSGITPYYKETDLNEIYNPVNDTWHTGPSIPTAVEGYASAVLNGKIYILGGSSQSAAADNSVVTDASQVFDPYTSIWNLTTRLPDATSYAAAVATQGLMAPQRIYCVGGYLNEFSAQTAVYFPENNSWNLAQDMPTARANLCVATLNDLVYAIGGLSDGAVLATNEVYTPYGYGTVAPEIQITSQQTKPTLLPLLLLRLIGV